MKSLINVLRKLIGTFIALLFIILVNYPLIIFLSILATVAYPIRRDGKFSRIILYYYVNIHSYIFNLYVDEIEFSELDKPYLVLMNFNSPIDFFAVLKVFKYNIAFILRYHNFYIPFFGWTIQTAQFIKFKPKEPYAFLNSSINCLRYKNLSVLHFPAGYNDIIENQRLLTNYKKILEKTNCDIIVLNSEHLPSDNKRSFFPSTRIKLTILDIISHNEYSKMKFSDLNIRILDKYRGYHVQIRKE